MPTIKYRCDKCVHSDTCIYKESYYKMANENFVFLRELNPNVDGPILIPCIIQHRMDAFGF